MAVRKQNVLGKLSGRNGNTVTRIRYGKEVVYLLPEKVNVSQSKQAKAARNKFGMTVSFAKYINSIPVLLDVWSIAKISGTNSYQKLIKHNAKLTGENNLTLNNIITPGGFKLIIEEFSFVNNDIIVSINLAGNNLFKESTLSLIIQSVLYFYEPKNENDKPFILSSIQKDIVFDNTDHILKINFVLDEYQKNLALNYNKVIIYLAAIYTGEGTAKSVWSCTHAKQIKLE